MTHQKPFTVSNATKPVDLVSWWTFGISRADETEWRARFKIASEPEKVSRR